MKNKLRALFVLIIGMSSELAWSQAEAVKLTIGADGQSAEYFLIEPNKPLVVDDRQELQFQKLVGCAGLDVTGEGQKGMVGRRLVVSVTRSGESALFVHVDYLSSKLETISSFKFNANCTINSARTNSVSTEMNLFLRRGSPVNATLPANGQNAGLRVTFEIL